MPRSQSPFATKELSKRTWPDFVELFTRGNGWDFCWCIHFHRCRASPGCDKLRRAERSVRNRRDKEELVERGRTHGILVYAGGEPVGWCQYGPRKELPRIDDVRSYRRLAPEVRRKEPWRITCFVVDKQYRGRGIASVALKAALEAIRKKGGGLVEGYPITHFRPGTFGNSSTHGTVTMFEREGFKTVAPFAKTIHRTNVLMRRTI
ncbi:MAG: GNAT family N-acetyltransferase [Candidatus Binatus sp.]